MSSLNARAVAAREHLSTGRERIRVLHDRGLDGPQVCARLTSLVDTVVIQWFEACLSKIEELEPTDAGESVPKSAATPYSATGFSAMEFSATGASSTGASGTGASGTGSLRNQVALVGHGGYGRRQSAPFSDVDLMILYEGRLTDEIALLARLMTQGIFDAGLQLGQSVRSVSDAVQLARTDPIICTSLIDSRLLVGKQSLFETFRTSFEKLVRKRNKPLAHAFLEARKKERDQYGETVYLLEPHVKRSRGGLRDMHLLRWLGFAEHGVADPDRRQLMGAISKFDHHRILSARAYLLRLRNEMHFHANSAKETLDRAEQLRIAERFAYRGSQGMLPVEQFMREYFRHTNHLWHLVRRREASLQVTSKVVRVLDPMLSKNVDGEYRIGLRTISTTPAGLDRLKGSLSEVIRLVLLSIQHEKLLEHVTWSALYLAAPNYAEEITPSIGESFWELLANPQNAGEGLRILHELGLLEKIIPPMRHARGLLQFNQYHKFTVDEHCLRAVRQTAHFAQRNDSLGEVSREIRSQQTLHLALLLHDLGKGFEEDHCEVGRRLAGEMAQRLGLTSVQTDDLVFLVHQHLMMAHLAFRRDTSDPQLIESFAEQVGSMDRLRMLLVLTCADLASVGPGVFNDWKLEVLDTLYRRAARLLPANDPSRDEHPTTAAKFEDLRTRVLQQLTADQRNDSWFPRQIAALPESYLTHRDPVEAAQTLRRLHHLTATAATVWGAYREETQTVEFLAGVKDGLGRGIFSSMAGVLTSQGLEILAADIETLADNLLLIRYVVTHLPAVTNIASAKGSKQKSAEQDQEQIEKLCTQMLEAIDSHEPPKFPRVWGQQQNEASAQLEAPPNEVRIDNRTSDHSTVIEVFTLDCTGLLYHLARQLHNQELIIRHAKISTSLDQVVDVFYVTDRNGQKITQAERLQTIRERLLEVIEGSV
jgi:[protein-PII] uridylyltransferase